jgi:hypothetical protein
MCHIHFPQQVDSKNSMKANFITGIGRSTFGGALLYYLQRKEDASTSTQLLVIWGYNSYWIYSHVWLIEYGNALIWSEDKLERLYDVYNNQYNASSNIGGWLLDDNTVLRIECETAYRGFEMKVVISKDEYVSSPRKPLWVDPNR